MSTEKMSTIETSAEKAARLEREAAAKQQLDAVKAAQHDEKVEERRAKETPEQRQKREAEEKAQEYTINQLGRIDEIRAQLGRANENYKASTSQVFQRLQAIVGDANPVVSKAAKAVADEYGIPIDPHGFQQPKLPKGAPSPFATKDGE